MRKGVATFTLDYGKCPPWLFERMVRLGREAYDKTNEIMRRAVSKTKLSYGEKSKAIGRLSSP